MVIKSHSCVVSFFGKREYSEGVGDGQAVGDNWFVLNYSSHVYVGTALQMSAPYNNKHIFYEGHGGEVKLHINN